MTHSRFLTTEYLPRCGEICDNGEQTNRIFILRRLTK